MSLPDPAAPRSTFGRPTGIVARGVVAGVVAATVMAAWFMMVDASEGSPFRTPNFLAGSLLGMDAIQMGIGPILLYTLVHYGVWIMVGFVAAWVLQHVETASPMLLGMVLGFLLFDLVFYGSVAIAGVNVVQQLGWPEVLAGNLMAGASLMGVLHWSGPTRKVTWWEALGENKVVKEGIV